MNSHFSEKDQLFTNCVRRRRTLSNHVVFSRGIDYVPRVSIAMPVDFRVWTPSWTGTLSLDFNNIIFVCKYYYMHTLMEELGINSGSTINSTYEKQDVTVDEIVRTHTTTLETIFHITLQQKEKNLPKIYWKPKLHKTPYKARFIAGSSSCTTTKISKLITECLKLVKSHCTSYCKTILERTGVNCMWIINNSLDVIHTLQEKQLILNQVSTWDFSTLYTSLPHAKLKHQLHDLLERVFNTRGKSFIATNNFHTFWANDRKSTKYTYFSCRELCLAIDFSYRQYLRPLRKLSFSANYWHTNGH